MSDQSWEMRAEPVERRVHVAALLDARFLTLVTSDVGAARSPPSSTSIPPSKPSVGTRARGAVAATGAAGVGVPARRLGRPIAVRRPIGLRSISPAELVVEAVTHAPPELAASISFLVESLDDRGLLGPAGVGGLAEVSGFSDRGVSGCARRRAGRWAAGNRARDPVDALLVQLGDLATLVSDAARTIVADHLALLAAGDIDRLCTETGLDRFAVEAAIDLVHTLWPYPGLLDWADPSSSPPPAPPDVVIAFDDGGPLRVSVLEAERWAVRTDPRFAQLLCTGERTEVIAGQVANANSLIRRLRRRWDTIQQVVDLATSRHEAQLRARSLAFHPLARLLRSPASSASPNRRSAGPLPIARSAFRGVPSCRCTACSVRATMCAPRSLTF